MTIPQFAHGRSQLPAPVVTKTAGVGNLTAEVAGTYYFRLQGQNRVGRTTLSAAVSIAVDAGDRINVEIPSTARGTAEDWHYFIISASLSNTASTFQQIGYYKGYLTDEVTTTALPATIVLDEDAHLALGAIVSNPSALPLGDDLLAGMIRGVSSTTYYYVYDPDSTATADGSTILDATPGNWVKTGPSGTYIADPEDTGGSAQDIRDLNESEIRFPDYVVSETSRVVGTPVKLWLLNDGSEPIAAGTRIGLVIQFNEIEKTKAFNGLLRVKFLGYANLTTGGLDTTGEGGAGSMLGVGEVTLFQARKTNLLLQKDLPAGQAYAMEIYPEFAGFELSDEIPVNARLRVYPFFYLQSGEFSEAGLALGEDWIYPVNGKRRVVPGSALGVVLLAGSYMVDSLSVRGLSQTAVSGLLADTASQKICINGLGAAWVEDGDVSESAALRAIVGTVDGTGAPSSYTSYQAVAENSGLTITVPYPCTSDGVGTVRADYPDRIAGNTDATFNCDTVTFYIQRQGSGQLRQFTGYAVVPGEEQEFNLLSWGDGTIISALPTVASDFGLFVPGTPTVTEQASVGTFPADNYRVCVAFGWVDAVTSISHEESDGCMFEPDATLVEVFDRIKYYGQGVPDLAALRSLALATVSPMQERRVKALKKRYYYDPDSYAVDDSTATAKFVRLNEVPPESPGRFIREDSSLWYGSDEDPASDLGGVGDFHVNRQTGDLSEKTGPTTWTTFVNLRGSKWYVIEEEPTAELGKVKDFALSPDGTFYEKTDAVNWTEQGSLQGPEGPSGSVSAASGLKLDHSSSPSTYIGQSALFVDEADKNLKIREESDGAEQTIAFLTKYQTYTAAQYVATGNLTPAANVTIDLSQSNSFKIVLNQNVAFTNPVNLADGQGIVLAIYQNGTGGYTVTFGSKFRFENDITPAISTDPNKLTLIDAWSDGTNLYCSMRGGFNGAA